MAINVRYFIHPEDESAMRQMENTTGFKMIADKFISKSAENFFFNYCVERFPKLGPQQLPEVYESLATVAQKFSIKTPDLFLGTIEGMPEIMTLGVEKPLIIISPALIRLFENDGLDIVFAHECGHILCGHSSYNTLLFQLKRYGAAINGIPGIKFGQAIIDSILLAVMYWARRAEYSADRFSLLYTGDKRKCYGSIMQLLTKNNVIAEKIDIMEYIDQRKLLSYEATGNKFYEVVANMTAMEEKQPVGTLRLTELHKWSNSADYRFAVNELENPQSKILCPNCQTEIAADWKFCRSCGTKIENNN